MTNEVAVKILNSENTFIGFEDFVPHECYFEEGCEEVKTIAIKAIEKQIPKKPDLEGDGYYNGELIIDTWICPGCGTRYELECDEYDFCPHCGQHINFSEVEE